MRTDDLIIRLHKDDNVAVVKRTAKAGTEAGCASLCVTCRQTIPAGHKVALKPVHPGEPLFKYGQIIGFASKEIAEGDHVHTHNVSMKDFGRDYRFCEDYRPQPRPSVDRFRRFDGYRRADGRAGTRNYIGVISSVNCSASVSRYVARHFSGPELSRDYPNVDGVVAFTHKSGCSILPTEPLKLLQRVLAGIARHPNMSGYVMIGLGCEVNQISQLIKDQSLETASNQPGAPCYLNIQSMGGVRKTVEAAVSAVEKLLPRINDLRRTPLPLSDLALAMNCGGSDANSGITANPALGVASDALVQEGGTSVLGETTEIYGAEHLLTRRSITREVGEKLVKLIHWWEDHVRAHGASIDNNPSFGNKVGGLTTIYEKSLGAVAKAGQSPLRAVYQYAEAIRDPGLCFMDTPGNDPASMTGLVSGGCNIGVFTTGRGSVFGCKPAPCIKVATQTPLYQWMEEDMDINAGTILDGTESVADVGRRIFERIIAVASGEKTKSELAGMGDEEFAPWMIGPLL